MLVDINAYTGHWPFHQRNYNTCEKRLERMNRFGVDLSVVSNLNGIFYKNPQAANEELFDEIHSSDLFKDRFIPFAVINPIYASWRDHFQTSIDKLGMKGIRIYPQYHGYSLTDPALVELVKRARDRGLPVAISLRMVDSRPSSWMDLERSKEWALKDVMPVLREVPDVKLFIVNVANGTQLSSADESLIKQGNVLMDTSGRNIIDLGGLMQSYGPEKFAYGSHAPMLDEVTGLLRIESLRSAEVNDEVKELLRHGNAKKMLGL
jgi:hypothetical protein